MSAYLPSVRPATEADALAAMDVLRRSITALCGADHGNDPAKLGPWLANKTEATWAKWLAVPEACLLVAQVQGRIAGVGMLGGKGVIQVNYVAPEARFKGVSTALVAALEAAARARGMARLRLDSTRTARRFYLARGYLPVEGHSTKMEKSLEQGASAPA